MAGKFRVILADDHAILRRGFVSTLEQSPNFQVVGEAGNGLELLNLLNQGVVPELLILDISMPVLSGIKAPSAKLGK